MDVVLYQEVFYSFGERQQAASFAHQIARAGYRPRFVVARPIAEASRETGFEVTAFDTPEQGVAAVDALAPALVVGCELFNLSPASIAGLAAGPWELATMDGTTLGAAIRTDPFGVPEYRESLALPERYRSLLPCPANDVEAQDDGSLRWPAFREASRVAKDPRLYGVLGLDLSRRTVLLPVAPWAQYFAELGRAPFLAFRGYHDRLLERVADGLAASGQPVELVAVMKRPPASREERGVRIRVPGLLPYAAFDHLLRSCDALVSDNVVQASLSKAVVLGTPHLLIQDSSPDARPFPWNIFPLKQVFPATREFSGLVDVAEWGDPVGMRERVAALLGDGHGDTERAARRRAYLERVRSLPDAGEQLEGLLGPARRG